MIVKYFGICEYQSDLESWKNPLEFDYVYFTNTVCAVSTPFHTTANPNCCVDCTVSL